MYFYRSNALSLPTVEPARQLSLYNNFASNERLKKALLGGRVVGLGNDARNSGEIDPLQRLPAPRRPPPPTT